LREAPLHEAQVLPLKNLMDLPVDSLDPLSQVPQALIYLPNSLVAAGEVVLEDGDVVVVYFVLVQLGEALPLLELHHCLLRLLLGEVVETVLEVLYHLLLDLARHVILG